VRARAALVGLLLAAVAMLPPSAVAYSTPSGLNPGSYSALCPPRPSDASASSGNPVLIDGSQSIPANGSAYFTASSNAPSGPAEVSVQDGGNKMSVTVQVQDSGGSWHSVAWWVDDSSGAAAGTQENQGYGVTHDVYLPGGLVRLWVQNYYTAADTFQARLTIQGVTAGDATVSQEIADGCYRREQLFSTQHSDLTSIDSDVKALTANGATLSTLDTDLSNVKSAVNGLTANSVTLSTLDADLRAIDSDVQAVKAAVQANGSGGSSSPAVVQLSSADRQLSSDIGTQLDGDIWVLIGALVGTLLLIEFLRKVWP